MDAARFAMILPGQELMTADKYQPGAEQGHITER